jgi:NAD(P)-dependent dehydrogenase (short-subunit alcohol dehydrogenase family)
MAATAAIGKTAVVTGGSRGIGRALAQALLDRGINVHIASSHGDEAAQAAAQLRQDRARAQGSRCDVTDPDAVRGLWDTACERFGGVDIWINNAGLALGGGLIDMPEADVRRMLDVNLAGLAHGCQTALRGWRAAGRNGALYTMLGAGADGTLMPFMNAYASTKAAATYLTRSLAAEVEGTGFVVGALSPGLVITEGFLREHAKMGGHLTPQRRDWVNLIADHPETTGRWAARIVDCNTHNGRTFTWLTKRKIRDRRKAAPRDVLSRYLAPAGA